MTTYLPTFKMGKKASSSKTLIGNEMGFLCKQVATKPSELKIQTINPLFFYFWLATNFYINPYLQPNNCLFFINNNFGC